MAIVQGSLLSEIRRQGWCVLTRVCRGKAGIVACSIQNRQVVKRNFGATRKSRLSTDSPNLLICCSLAGPVVTGSIDQVQSPLGAGSWTLGPREGAKLRTSRELCCLASSLKWCEFDFGVKISNSHCIELPFSSTLHEDGLVAAGNINILKITCMASPLPSQ